MCLASRDINRQLQQSNKWSEFNPPGGTHTIPIITSRENLFTSRDLYAKNDTQPAECEIEMALQS